SVTATNPNRGTALRGIATLSGPSAQPSEAMIRPVRNNSTFALAAALACSVGAAGCTFFRSSAPPPAPPPTVATAPVEPEPPQIAQTPSTIVVPQQGNDEPVLPWPERTLAKLTLREKIG